MITLGLRPQTK